MENQKFKKTARFTCFGSFIKPDSIEGKKIAKASITELESLRSLAPTDEEIAANHDLLYVSFNGAVTSLVNLNHDSIDNETAVRISKSFIHRYINIEHSRESCIGVILNSGFSTFKDNQLVEADEVLKSKKPYNMSFCGVIWKVVDPSFASMVKDSNDPESWMYRKISASWEIGFNEWAIVRGSRTLENAEIIDDPEQVEALSKYLVDEGGSGFDEDNREVYRLIKGGDVMGFGMGLVRNPAASVQGIQALEFECKEEEMDDSYSKLLTKQLESASFKEDITSLVREEIVKACCKNTENLKKDEKSEKIISQQQKTIVKARKNMKFKNVDALLESLVVAEASAATPQSVREFIEETIYEAGKDFKQKEDAFAAEKADKEKALKEVETKQTEAEAKISDLEEKLADLQAQAVEAKKQATFQERMAGLSQSYNLTEKVQKVVAKQIRELSDDEYKAWLKEDAEVILASHKKEQGESKEDEATRLMKQSEATVKFVPNAKDAEDKPTNYKVAKRGEDFEIQF